MPKPDLALHGGQVSDDGCAGYLVYLFVKDESDGRTEDLCWLISCAEEQSVEHR